MLINRVIEWGRRRGLSGRLLVERARRAGPRRPVVLVPGMFGTRLVDERGRVLWGDTQRLYHGPPLASGTALDARCRTDGEIDGLTLVPGLWSYDIYGGLCRLLDVAGWRRGAELHVLAYDWRTGIADASARLAELVARLRGIGDERVDLVGVSTGGLVVRHFATAPSTAASVGRAVYVGAPQRGTFDAVAGLALGFRFAPGGKHRTPVEAARCQTSFDALPHPDEGIFVDEKGRPLALDHFDPEVWRRLGLAPDAVATAGFAARLEAGRQLHRTLDESDRRHAAPPIVIGGSHRLTPARAVVSPGGRAVRVPPPIPAPQEPLQGAIYVPGDGELTDASLRGLPDLDPAQLWPARPAAHHLLSSDPQVQRLIVEALLSPLQPMPLTSWDRDAVPVTLTIARRPSLG